MTFSMARQVVVEMAHSFRVEPSRYDGGDRLPAESYAMIECAFEQAGLVWEGGPDSRTMLHALRSTYEPLLDGLARHLLLPLPSWVPADRASDHFEQGHRGPLARRLIDELTGNFPPRDAAQATPAAAPWRRLRERLRREDR